MNKFKALVFYNKESKIDNKGILKFPEGDIMDTLTEKLYNEEDLMKISSSGRYELLKGVIYKMAPAGEEHGVITSKIISRLNRFVEEKNLGIITAAETGYKLSSEPDTVRAPDAAFKSNERLIKSGMSKGYSTVMPDLLVEVNSPSDSYGKVIKKVMEWIKAGVKEVWVVDPEDLCVIVYDSNWKPEVFSGDDELSGGKILPGFKCKVREFFVTGNI